MNLTIDLDDLLTPLPTQAAFMDAVKSAPPWSLPAYIGAVGSGKSTILCRIGLGLAFAHPGIKCLIGRHNFTELRDTTLTTFFDMTRTLENHVRDRLPPARRHEFQGIGTFRKDTGDYSVFNGSTLMFRHLEDGHRRFKSLEIGAFGVDESSEVEPEQEEPPTILMLQARLRQKGMPHVGFLVSNPTGFDHWMYRWYGKGVETRYGVGAKGWPVFRTNMAENAAYLPAGYEADKRKTMPASWVKRYIEGEWGGIDDGAPVFPTFDPLIHVRPLEWLRRQHVHVGIDLGYRAPGVVWSQMDPGPSKRLHVLRSWGPQNLDTYKLAEGIKARNEAWFPQGRFQYYCGHDGKSRSATTRDTDHKTSAEILASYGMSPRIRFTAKGRGLSTIRSLLDVRDDGLAGLLIAPDNPVLIEGMRGGYRYDPDHEDETLDSGPYPPFIDALRYIAVNLYTTAGTVPSYGALPAFAGLGPRR